MNLLRRENVLYIIAFLLALTLRLLNLGSLPLTDLEAKWALQAYAVAQGAHPALGSQPAYILLTALIFFIFGGATNFLARLIPALTGSVLVFIPYLFRSRLKPRPALILAFFLALEPGLVAVSRQAGSSILAVTFLLLAWGLWEHRRSRWAGIFAGFALLSGPALWEGLLGLGLTWAVYQGMERRTQKSAAEGRTRNEWLTALWFCLGTIVLAGTLFFIAPNGLSAWLSALPEFIQGWVQPSGISSGMLLFSLITYQPLGLFLAGILLVRGWFSGSRRAIRLSIWMLVALLIALFYPAHQVTDLVWMLIPLWSLAALELSRNWIVYREERSEVLGLVGLSGLILVFMWLDFLALLQTAGSSDQTTLRAWLLFGSLFLLAISVLLVAVGWSIRSARLGAIWGLTLALGVYAVGAMVGAAGLRVEPTVEMWSPGRSIAQADTLLMTVSQISDWSDKNINSQSVTIAGVDSPALEWLLRGNNISVVKTLDASAAPSIVISTNASNPKLAAGYRGQSFIWRQNPLWSQAQFADWLRWAAFHDMPQNSETLIIWVRSDLFLDSPGTTP